MKLNNMLTTAVLALVGMTLIETSASAQLASTGDLILGFRITDSTTPGNTTNLEVDLGAFGLYTALEHTGAVENLNVGSGNFVDGGLGGLSVADLSTVYGSTWNARNDLVWGVVGTNGSPSNESFLTTPGSTALFDNTTLPVAGKLSPLYAGFDGTTLTGNSATAGTITTATSGSWTFQLTNNGGNTATNDFGTGFVIEQGVTSSGATSLTLFDLTKHTSTTPGVEVGTFVLGSDGSFTFDATAAAVPEPSTYALFGFSALALLMMSRRLNRA